MAHPDKTPSFQEYAKRTAAAIALVSGLSYAAIIGADSSNAAQLPPCPPQEPTATPRTPHLSDQAQGGQEFTVLLPLIEKSQIETCELPTSTATPTPRTPTP